MKFDLVKYKPLLEFIDEAPKKSEDLNKKIDYLKAIKIHNRLSFIRNISFCHEREIRRGYLVGSLISTTLLLTVFIRTSLVRKLAIGGVLTHIYGLWMT